MSYEYKCVPFPIAVQVTKLNTIEGAIQNYEGKINELANQGWEFVNSDTLTTVQNPGCIGGLLGASAQHVPHKLLIFRRLKA